MMQLDAKYEPEFESVKRLLLDMAQERSIDVLFDMIVERMTQRQHVALTCIWMIRENEACPACRLKELCSDRKKCLRLDQQGSEKGGRNESFSMGPLLSPQCFSH
ncbi:MAG: hypothetical protein GY866_18350 [Proteobacteria bacterium]|nr:hypothetical protein [Pseudomonadota bacterium]